MTYNGDFFDWPFIETRAAKHELDMHDQIGFRMNRKTNECLSKFAVHMDCLAWVNRDSYLPQGSRGLKVMSPPGRLMWRKMSWTSKLTSGYILGTETGACP